MLPLLFYAAWGKFGRTFYFDRALLKRFQICRQKPPPFEHLAVHGLEHLAVRVFLIPLHTAPFLPAPPQRAVNSWPVLFCIVIFHRLELLLYREAFLSFLPLTCDVLFGLAFVHLGSFVFRGFDLRLQGCQQQELRAVVDIFGVQDLGNFLLVPSCEVQVFVAGRLRERRKSSILAIRSNLHSR